jgi:hypothetical protein
VTDKLKTLILMGVKQSGSYDPDEALVDVESYLNNMEYTTASMFLRWVIVHNKKFGTATFEKVFKEFKRAISA